MRGCRDAGDSCTLLILATTAGFWNADRRHIHRRLRPTSDGAQEIGVHQSGTCSEGTHKVACRGYVDLAGDVPMGGRQSTISWPRDVRHDSGHRDSRGDV